jgi:iron complex outermembrane receptor protein
MQNSHRLLARAISIALAMGPATVRAQAITEASVAPGAGALEQIVVTARRREERQQDVPLAVTALGQDFLSQNTVTKITDLNGKVPALRIESFNSPSYTNVGIRAQRSANIAPGQDSAVGYYLNEVNYGFPVGINQQMFDLHSVEIVKGPQGTLFGRNTTGGALLITSARPQDGFSGTATAGFTSFASGSGYTATGVLNAPVGERLKLRAAVSTIQRDGYVENLITTQQLEAYEVTPWFGTTNRDPLNEEKSTGWRLSALWQPTDSVESLLVYQGSRMRGNGTAYTLTALNEAGFTNFATGGGAQEAFLRRQDQQQKNFWTVEQGADLSNELDTSAITNVTTWQINDSLTLKNVAGYRDFENRDQLGLSGLPYQILDVRIPDLGHEWSEELQLQGESDGGISWVGGAYYSSQHINHPNDTLALPQFGSTGTGAQSLVDNTSRAIFGQATFPLAMVEGVSLTAGARYTKDDRDMTARKFVDVERTTCALTDGQGATLPDDACFLHGDKSFSETTYNVSLDYKITGDALVYLAHRRGYRSGGFNYLPDNPQTFGPFDPEIVEDFELGLKKDWVLGSGAGLRTNIAIYTQDYQDIQRITSPVSDPSSFSVINAASATINGGEVEITLQPIDGLEISAYYAHVDAQFDDFTTGVGDFTDNKMAQVPEDQYSGWVRYTLPLADAIGPVSLQANYAYQTRVYFSDTAQGPNEGPYDSQSQEGYGILNLRADWQDVMGKSIDLAVYVNNATATKYNSFGIQLYPSLGYNIATIGEPRIYGAEATFRF